MKYRDVTLSEIRRLPELQPRVSLSMDRVEQYAAAYRDGDEFPHLILYEIDGVLYLTQGWHRLAGAEAAGRQAHLCEVRLGSMADAEWDAATSNKDGDKATLYRSNADKARAVQLALHARPMASDHEIARAVAVDPKTVGSHRRASREVPQIEKRTVTRNGKEYEQDTAKIGKTPRAKTADVPAPEAPYVADGITYTAGADTDHAARCMGLEPQIEDAGDPQESDEVVTITLARDVADNATGFLGAEGDTYTAQVDRSGSTYIPVTCGASRGGGDGYVWLEAEDFELVSPLPDTAEAVTPADPSDPHDYPAVKQALLDTWADCDCRLSTFLGLVSCAIEEIKEECDDDGHG